MTKTIAPQHAVVAHPWFECPLCSAEIRAAESMSAKLISEGASDQEVQDAAHKPRFAALDGHARFMVAEGWSTYI